VNLILFDGQCKLCNYSVLFIIKRDKKAIFKFASLQSEVGRVILNQFGIDPMKVDSIVYIKENNYFLRSSAILNILKDLGGKWRLFFALIIIPRFIRDAIYNIIANSRYRLFGKQNRCVVSDDEISDIMELFSRTDPELSRGI